MHFQKRSRIQWALLVLTGIAFGLRLYQIEMQSLWRDEVDAILFATGPWPALIAMFSRAGENGPLYFLLLRPWIALFGDGACAVRYFSVLPGVLTVPLCYQLGRRLLSDTAGILAALLVATSPYLIWYSQETKMYALLACLSALSTWLLLRALQEDRTAAWIAYVVVTSLGFYTHILAVVLLPFHVALFALGGTVFHRRWPKALAALACLTVPYLPLARWEIPTLLSSFETGHPFTPLSTILLTLFQVLSFGFRSPSLIEVGAVVFALLAGTFQYRHTTQPRSFSATYPQAVWWLYILVPILVVYLISLGMPIFTDRYLITIAAGFYLLLATGLDALRRRSGLIFALCLLAILVSDARSIWFQSHTTIKADFRSAAAYYGAHASADDLLVVQMPYVHRNFEYYYRQPYHRADGLFTNAGLLPGEVADKMTALTAGYDTIWLLESEAEMWDESGLVRAWLDEHGRTSDQVAFQRIELTRYELPGSGR